MSVDELLSFLRDTTGSRTGAFPASRMSMMDMCMPWTWIWKFFDMVCQSKLIEVLSRTIGILNKQEIANLGYISMADYY